MRGRLLREDETGWWYGQYLCKDFPENEIKPLKDILKLVRDGNYDIFVYGDEKVMGYATVWKKQGLRTCLLDYLGVPEALRNQGIGQKILRDTGERITGQKDTGIQVYLILESEALVPGGDEAENHIRRRRIAFYERNGFKKIYEMGTCGMRFVTMAYQCMPENMAEVMREHKAIYGPERDDVVVPLPEGEKPPMPYWSGV